MDSHTEEYSVDISTLRSIRQKIVLVGDVAVGKTSIINRFINDQFKESYDVTNHLKSI
jgi:GTPase SAR1 family protein